MDNDDPLETPPFLDRSPREEINKSGGEVDQPTPDDMPSEESDNSETEELQSEGDARGRCAVTVATAPGRGFLLNSTAVTTPLPNALLQVLTYVAKGWHVFPVPTGEKKSHKSAKYSDGRPWGATTEIGRAHV